MARAVSKSILGKTVRGLRLKAGFTQAELSQRAGIFRTHLARIEGGSANPTLTAIVAIARGLNVDPEKLFDHCQAPDSGTP